MPANKPRPIAPADANAGRVLGHLMAVRGLSQTKLSELTGVHQSAISRHLKGGRGWSASLMHTYADALDVNPAIFLEDSDKVLARLDEALRFARESELPAHMGWAA